MSWNIRHGDCREVMRTLDPESVDSIVSDPPYGLSFMGKGWDSFKEGDIAMRRNPQMDAVNTGASRQGGRQRACVDYQKRQARDMLAFQEAMNAVFLEAIRVAKPGAHLLAFGGTRTYHRLACAIEDAGWEIRDCAMWVYGSGFPKSHDVSKAIDKMDASEEQERRRLRFTAWVRSTGVTSRQIDEATGTNMGGHYTTAASQPAVMTREHLESCRHLLGDVPEWVEREADIRSVESRNMAERKIVGPTRKGAQNESTGKYGAWGDGITPTAPATDAAKQWSGWGTALKPAYEPIIVARKPLCGTVAENVLEHGTGGINVDGCRVGTEAWSRKATGNSTPYGSETTWNTSATPDIDRSGVGRWPANLIHDGSDEVVGLFPERDGAVSNGSKGTTGSNGIYNEGWGAVKQKPGRADSGSAARFFYCAKASKADRDADNKHPTVKPTALMRYLCRLVTPPGGVVLDPFTGSGSTGKAAILEGFRFIGIEREAEYVEIAKARIGAAEAGAGPLFSQ
jgi:DNA modification methylase